MKVTLRQKKEIQRKILLRDYGYTFLHGTLIEDAISGWTPDRVIGKRRNLFDAVESLIPIVNNEEFTTRALACTI